MKAICVLVRHANIGFFVVIARQYPIQLGIAHIARVHALVFVQAHSPSHIPCLLLISTRYDGGLIHHGGGIGFFCGRTVGQLVGDVEIKTLQMRHVVTHALPALVCAHENFQTFWVCRIAFGFATANKQFLILHPKHAVTEVAHSHRSQILVLNADEGIVAVPTLHAAFSITIQRNACFHLPNHIRTITQWLGAFQTKLRQIVFHLHNRAFLIVLLGIGNTPF